MDGAARDRVYIVCDRVQRERVVQALDQVPGVTVRAVVDERARADDAGLTAREREVLELLDRGLSNKEIARELCIQVSTVKNHVHHILEKLGVGRRSAAVARARRPRQR